MTQVSPIPLRKEENWNPTSPTFFLADTKKIAYLQIPKAACSTFMSMILRLEKPERYEEIESRLSATVFELHRDAELFTRSDQAPGRARFTFVRHPLRRIESFFRKQIAAASVNQMDPAHVTDLTRNLAISDLEPRLDFSSFIDRLIDSPRALSNIHVRRQVDFLYGDDGPRCDFIGRLEDLNQYQNFLEALFGMEDMRLPRFNSSGKNRDPFVYSDEQLARLRAFYAADLQLLGYSI